MAVQVIQFVYDDIAALQFVYQRNADTAADARDAAEIERALWQERADSVAPVVADVEVA